MDNREIINKIFKLKKEKNALILAHYYVPLEVHAVADHVCDSFEMAKRARQAAEKLIVICGVHFMGESAKILSPDKKVLIPAQDAGCPMADTVTVEDVKSLKAKHPDATVMCYVNSSAAVKAVSDICCTSSSALRIADAVDSKEIIFVPDMHLGEYTAEKVPGKTVVCHTGYCPVHHALTKADVLSVKKAHPGAKFAAHPECRADVLNLADFIGSTSEIIKYAQDTDAKELIVGTEAEITELLKEKVPGKMFYSAKPDFVCWDMKKITLLSVLACLEKEQYEIVLEKDELDAAAQSLERMVRS